MGIEAWGSSLPELFLHAAQAVLELMADTSQIRPERSLEFEVEGRDVEGLIVNWLNEIIFLHEAKEMLFAEVQVLQFTGLSIKGRLQGEAIDLERHQLNQLIKGVTYHRLSIKQLERNKWWLQVILDV
jgi:SHS2 domain-containing protein